MRFYTAFERFQELVREQEKAIRDTQASRSDIALKHFAACTAGFLPDLVFSLGIEHERCMGLAS